jgi:hypothetical protein
MRFARTFRIVVVGHPGKNVRKIFRKILAKFFYFGTPVVVVRAVGVFVLPPLSPLRV